MTTVTFEGVEYVKASQVAKKFGYTSDYIGQLCRAKKVNARLVGRSWFVNMPSLEAHRDARYQTQRKKTVTPTQTTVTSESSSKTRTTVPASKKYLRRVSAPDARLRKITDQTTGPGNTLRHVPVRYESDERGLLPTVRTNPKVTLLKVDIAESENLTVTSQTKKSSTLLPEELPDVALSGKLTIAEIPDDQYSNEVVAEDSSFKRDNNKNKGAISDEENNISVQADQEVASIESSKRAQNSQTRSTSVEVRPSSIKRSAVATAKNTAEQSDEFLDQYHPNEVRDSRLVHRAQLIPVAGLLLGVFVSSLLLSMQQVGYVTAEFADFELSISWSNIRNLATVLFTS